ncbi:type II toxin-antitoxin system RelE/ParE family toxin [Fodinibius sp.]|uniref:type II toxin-antitoxin system RelE/ParE family toxin n=1 Tax=Fodinibius sp. TaxID=1872440 RepID=UPI002ACDD64E|nr:type II toxin-antitoxin system RelE/ParE family toxin [Fodinibius sp.]MDZ7658647.1 type II toxin-antitoxin system RelE/ParE family toxin [Fodinibius sp.]
MESSKKIQSIKKYLLEKWSKKEVQNFLKKLHKFEELVLHFPKLYPASQKHPKLRKAPITKHHSVIYEINNDTIQVYTILDHRQQNR